MFAGVDAAHSSAEVEGADDGARAQVQHTVPRAMATHSSFWVLVPGLVIWGVGGGVTFPAMFVSAATGVGPQEAGIASALATAAQQIGRAAGLALLIAVSTARFVLHSGAAPGPTAIDHGLRLAMFAGAGASVVGGLLAFTLRKPGAAAVPQPTLPADAANEVNAGPQLL